MNKKLILIIVLAAVIIAVAVVFYMNRGSSVVIQQPQVSALLAEAKKMEESNDLVSARLAYQKLINDYSNSREIMDWQKRFEDLNIGLLFSPVITPKSIEYEIKPGDSLDKIAREYKTTVELIMKSNNLPGANGIPLETSSCSFLCPSNLSTGTRIEPV